MARQLLRARAQVPGLSERDLHKQVAAYLDVSLPPDAPWTTIGHGAYLGDETKTVRGRKVPMRALRAKQLKDIGVKNGWPDIAILWKGRFIGIELKREAGGVVSEAQEEVHKRIILAGGVVTVFRSLDAVIDFLRVCGVPLRDANARAA